MTSLPALPLFSPPAVLCCAEEQGGDGATQKLGYSQKVVGSAALLFTSQHKKREPKYTHKKTVVFHFTIL